MVAGGHAWLAGGMRGCRGGHVWLQGGGHAWLQGACVVTGGCAWLQGGMHGCGGGVCMVRGGRDTVNERAVRILLECILVTCKSSNASFSTSKSVKSKWSLK